MSAAIPALVVALKTITLVLGGLITLFAYRAYRRTDARPLGVLALGFAVVTVGVLVAGAGHQAFGLDSGLVLSIESTLTTLGFAVILYSLYAN